MDAVVEMEEEAGGQEGQTETRDWLRGRHLSAAAAPGAVHLCPVTI